MTITENPSIQQLQAENAHLNHQLVQLNQENSYLKEQLEWLKRQLFGKRSEKVVSNLDDRQLIFKGFEHFFKPEEKESKPVSAHKRRINRKDEEKIALDPDLPVKTTTLDVPEEKKVCPETGEPLVQMGVEKSYKLAHQPGSYYVKEIIRPKYVHPRREETGVLTAEMPPAFLPKTQADESLLAEIVTQKFGDHLPLYRIAEMMGRQGVKISRKLLSQWVIRAGKTLKPLYEEMLNQILHQQNIFIDETPVRLQAKGKCKQGYMWVVVGGKAADPPYRIYDFRENRCHGHVLDILKGYRGGLHSDKYSAYQRLAEKKLISWYPCFSHIRRKFFEAESGDPDFRKWVLRKIRHLFLYERVAWARSSQERLKIRQEKEARIIDELIEKIKAKLMDNKILPKSKLREAMGYFCGLIPYLKNYISDPFARIDNNVAERAVRPLALGRKNWLFFGSSDGAEAGSILLSFVQTCRGLKINPREYLEDVFRRFMDHPANRLYELLPDQWLEAKKNST